MGIPAPQNSNKSDRIFGLDIFRATAIILVVLQHGKFLLDKTPLNGFPFFKMIDGVDLFFVLSGFLIGGILLKEINSKEKFGIRKLTRFWKRRWLRTLPNYYLILLLNYLVVRYGIIQGDIQQFNWKFLVFFQNFSFPFYGFFWESWSLSVEEWFYLSTPLFLTFLLLVFSPRRSFLIATLMMIIFPLIYRMFSHNPAMDDFLLDVSFRKVVVTRLDSIAFGLLASWIFYYFQPWWIKFRIAALITGIALIVFILNYKVPCTTFYKQVISFSLTPFSAMLLLPFAQSISSANGIVAKSITHISKISYSMYLINLALAAEVFRANFPPGNGIDGILKYGLFWIVVIISSTILYTYFEKPIMNLRN